MCLKLNIVWGVLLASAHLVTFKYLAVCLLSMLAQPSVELKFS